MSVHQLPDGRWFVKYARGTNKDDPGRQREYFGRGPEAEEAAHRRNMDLGLGSTRNPSGPTFADIASDYLSVKEGSMSPRQLQNLIYQLEGLILPILGGLAASRVTPAELDKYVAARRGAGIKMNSVARELSTIRAIIRRAAARKVIPENPMTGFEMPRGNDAVILPPTAAEVSAILSHAEPHLARAIMLGAYTAMRPGRSELLSLRWEHVDLINGGIFVESAKKGGMRARVVPIAAALSPLLEKWRVEDSGSGPLAWVVHYQGRKLASLHSSWATAKKRAGVTRRCRLYDLRHYAASAMLAAGADLKSVSEILGHASPDMTMRIYQHTSTGLRRDAISRIGNLLPNVTQNK